MSLKDSLKGKTDVLKDKASHLAGKHNDTIDEMVDKAGHAADAATRHKYTEKIEHGTEKAKHKVDEFATKPRTDWGPKGS
ncbi:antitoxin [Kitasatospora camelliae]|uniref:Antitoxin n=1 Tax=Kitasatospora camelliae TaxID=3156397 RepID=A0AAU8K078_9ACTN